MLAQEKGGSHAGGGGRPVVEAIFPVLVTSPGEGTCTCVC